MKKRLWQSAMPVLILSIGLISPAYGAEAEKPKIAAEAEKPKITAEAKKPKITIVKKQVIGAVAGISKDFIAVDYAYETSGARELAINMAKDAKIAHKELSEIGLGDIVAVTYEETYETKEGEPPKLMKREAKLVEFRKPAVKALSSGSSHVVKTEGEGDIPIKGMRQ